MAGAFAVTRVLWASPLGLLIGLVLGALGSGGSIIAVPALVYAAGQTPQDATSTSLLLVGTAALSALWPHARARRVRWAMGTAFGMTGLGGSLLGTALNRRLNPDLLLLAFSALIVVAAHRMLTACPSCTRAGEDRTIGEDGISKEPRLTLGRGLLILAVGTLVGFLTGLFGVGGGFVIVPALTLVLGFRMAEAIGTSLLVVSINSAIAFAARLGTAAPIDWGVAIPFTVAAVVGAQVGGRMAKRLDASRSLRAFAAGLTILAVYTASRAVLSLVRATG